MEEALGFFLKESVSPLRILSWLPTAIVSGSMPLCFGAQPQLLHFTVPFLRSSRPQDLSSSGHPTCLFPLPACHSPNPALETPASPKGFVQLLLFPRCLSQPQTGPSPWLPLQGTSPAPHYLHSTVLWARLCSRRRACSVKHVRKHSCPRGSEFQWEFLKIP